MDWQNASTLVTGAGGFIASHLAERLVRAGARTRAFIRYTSSGKRGWLEGSPEGRNIEFIFGDLRDRDSVRRAMRGVDVVFHLGALIAIPYSYEAPESYVETNIVGTLNVLEAAREFGTSRVVHTSTSEVYGTAEYVPIDEKHPLKGQSPYSATKIGADKLAESYFLSFGLPVATVRPFNTYGPRQSARAVIPTIMTQVLTSSEIRLGNTAPTRDLNFVADTVEGFLAVGAADSAVGETVNLATGHEISIGDLAVLIGTLAGREICLAADEQRMRPDKSEVERLCGSAAKAKALCNWEPQHSLRDGLSITLQWVQQNLGGYRIGEYSI